MYGLWIPVNSQPEIITQDLQSSILHVFGSDDVVISTFNGEANYYHYDQKNYSHLPVNHLATVLKRIYTNNYNILLRGDILVYSSSDKFPHIIDDSVPFDFLQQVAMHTMNFNYGPSN
jgi:hypothetical protein